MAKMFQAVELQKKGDSLETFTQVYEEAEYTVELQAQIAVDYDVIDEELVEDTDVTFVPIVSTSDFVVIRFDAFTGADFDYTVSQDDTSEFNTCTEEDGVITVAFGDDVFEPNRVLKPIKSISGLGAVIAFQGLDQFTITMPDPEAWAAFSVRIEILPA